MRVLEGEQIQVRVFIGEAEKWGPTPLSIALVERLRKEGFAGATVFRGVLGFGGASVIHAAHLLELSADLPEVIEVVDSEEQVQTRLLPILDEMVGKGLVTMEKVRVLRYRPRAPEPSAPEAAPRSGRLRRALSRRKKPR
jgi:PII-like signaling protein